MELKMLVIVTQKKSR